MKHMHYLIQAYTAKTDDGQLMDVATIDIFAKSEAEALKRARTILKKDFYRVHQVVEHDPALEK